MTTNGDARARRKAAGRAEQEAAFEHYRESLGREMMRLASFIALYQKLHDLEPNHERLTTEVAPGFFSTVDDALFASIVVSVARLMGEPKGDEWNLESFLRFIEANLWLLAPKELQRRRQWPDSHWRLERARQDRITQATIEADRERLRQMECLRSFRTRRDGYHAHLDRKYLTDPARLHVDAPLDMVDLQRVLDVAKEIFNRYSGAFDGNTYEITPMNIGDITWLLTLADDGLKAFEQTGE